MADGLRIALLMGDMGVGGAQKQGYYMARALKQSGADVRIFYTIDEPSALLDDLRGMGVTAVWFGQQNSRARRLLKLFQLVYDFRPHVLFSTRTYTNLYVGILGRILRIPSFGTLRNSVVYERQIYSDRQFKLMCTLPRAMIVNSYLAKQQLEALNWIPADNISVLWNVIDLDDFDRKAAQPLTEPIEPSPKNIFFVGRLVAQKRIPWLIEAFALALQQVPDFHLYLVGDGDEQTAVETTLEAKGIEGNVTLLGRRSDVPALLQQVAGMLVLTSLEEGFPNVVAEAMAASLPVISTKAGDVEKIVGEGETGYLVNGDDIITFAERLVHLAQHPDVAEQFGAAARAKAEREYGVDNFDQRILEQFTKYAKLPGINR